MEPFSNPCPSLSFALPTLAALRSPCRPGRLPPQGSATLAPAGRPLCGDQAGPQPTGAPGACRHAGGHPSTPPLLCPSSAGALSTPNSCSLLCHLAVGPAPLSSVAMGEHEPRGRGRGPGLVCSSRGPEFLRPCPAPSRHPLCTGWRNRAEPARHGPHVLAGPVTADQRCAFTAAWPPPPPQRP